VKREKKTSKPAPAQTVKSAPTDSEIDIGGQVYEINLITPGSQFWPRCTPVPSGTLVSRQFAAEIEAHRIDPDHQDEPLEPTITFQLNTSYAIGPDGRRLAKRVEQQAVAAAYALQADNDLREREREAREAVEHEEWFQERQAREIELGQKKMRCLEEIDRRRFEAEDFLAAERAQQEEQEREATIPTISKGTP
jgi:hypothetical protein